MVLENVRVVTWWCPLTHSSVLPDDSRASRQRTRVVRRSLSPVFNHTMVYDGFGPADLRQACAELSLWDHGTLGSRQLGGTRLSLGTGETSRASVTSLAHP